MRQSVRLSVLTTALLTLGGFAVPAAADVITMPQAAGKVVDMPPPPKRGHTMNGVRLRLGEPQQRKGPVGDPPITRWYYDGLIVVFERDMVITSVIPAAPSPLFHTEELQR